MNVSYKNPLIKFPFGTIEPWHYSSAWAGRHGTPTDELGYVPTHLVVGMGTVNWAMHWAKDLADAEKYIETHEPPCHPSYGNKLEIIPVREVIPKFFSPSRYLVYKDGDTFYKTAIVDDDYYFGNTYDRLFFEIYYKLKNPEKFISFMKNAYEAPILRFGRREKGNRFCEDYLVGAPYKKHWENVYDAEHIEFQKYQDLVDRINAG